MPGLTVNYAPSPGQLQFHQDRHVYPERCLSCGTGGGKTYAGCFEALSITFTEPPGVGILAAPTFPVLERGVYATFEKLLGAPLWALPKQLGTFKQSPNPVFRWSNGWTWYFVTMDDPKQVEGIPEAVFVYLDEPRLLGHKFGGRDGARLNLKRRLRGTDQRRRYFWTTTHSPTAPIYKCYVKDNNPTRKLYSWGTMDAARWGTLSQKDADDINADYTDPDDRAAILYGEYRRPSGVVYKSWNRDRHLKEWSRQAPDYYTIGIDPGWQHMGVVLLNAWYGDSVHTVFEVSEEKMGEDGVLEAVARIQREYRDAPLKAIVGHDVRGGELVEKIQALGVPCEMYSGRVYPGLMSLDARLAGGSWLVDPGCLLLVESMDEYSWEESKGSNTTKPGEAYSDAPDAARYGILGERPVRGGVW